MHLKVISGLSLVAAALAANADMRLTFLDVGQADSALVQIDQLTGEPFTILVDAGDGTSDLLDNLPGLLEDDLTIEVLVLSHPHNDHMGGLDWLLLDSDIPIDRIWWGGDQHTTRGFEQFRRAIDESKRELIRPAKTLYVFGDQPNFAIRVFSNGMEYEGTAGHQLNNDSIVLHVVYEPEPGLEVAVLFTGDIEGEAAQELVAEFGDELQSDVVKVPHHGSDHTFEGFPAAVRASLAIVSSSGTHGTFKHPRKEALNLYEAHGDVLCTCDAAEETHHVTITVDEDGEISASAQPPYHAWARNAAGNLELVTVTPQ